MDTRAFDFTVIFSVVPALLSYLDVTLAVALASIALGSLWGAALSGAKVAGGKALRGLAQSAPAARCEWHYHLAREVVGALLPSCCCSSSFTACPYW